MTPRALIYGGMSDAVQELVGTGNLGLEWQRYLSLWEGTERVSKLYESLKAFTRGARRGNEQQGHLGECRARLQRAVQELAQCRGLDVCTWDGTLSWRLALGLGLDHPTENGFTFHHSLGIPVIPGSSIKGLCRSAATLYGWETEEIERLFGPKEVTGKPPSNIGAAVFLEAYPMAWPELIVDITNNHHPAYYGESNKSKATPVETEEPNPVNFIAVRGGMSFRFLMLTSASDKTRLEQLLQSALQDLGIGGKTAVGYGRFMGQNITSHGNRETPRAVTSPATITQSRQLFRRRTSRSPR